jgi:hypothetical protein
LHHTINSWQDQSASGYNALRGSLVGKELGAGKSTPYSQLVRRSVGWSNPAPNTTYTTIEGEPLDFLLARQTPSIFHHYS